MSHNNLGKLINYGHYNIFSTPFGVNILKHYTMDEKFYNKYCRIYGVVKYIDDEIYAFNHLTKLWKFENPSQTIIMGAYINSIEIDVRSNIFKKFPLSEDSYLRLLSVMPSAICDIPDPSFKIVMKSIESDPYNINKIKKINEEMIDLALELNPMIVTSLKNPTSSHWKKAIHLNPSIIMFMDNPSDDLCLIAIRAQLDAIKYIKNPSKVVQFFAIEQYPNNIKNINRPSIDSYRLAMIKDINYYNNFPKNIKKQLAYLYISLENSNEIY